MCLCFTDFCDYFLNQNINIDRIPEECMCQWSIISESSFSKLSQQDSNKERVDNTDPFSYVKQINNNYHKVNYLVDNNLKFSAESSEIVVPPIRNDIDLKPYNLTRCKKYWKNIQHFTESPGTEIVSTFSSTSTSPTTNLMLSTTTPVIKKSPSTFRNVAIATVKAAAVIIKREKLPLSKFKILTFNNVFPSIITTTLASISKQNTLKLERKTKEPLRMRFITENDQIIQSNKKSKKYEASLKRQSYTIVNTTDKNLANKTYLQQLSTPPFNNFTNNINKTATLNFVNNTSTGNSFVSHLSKNFSQNQTHTSTTMKIINDINLVKNNKSLHHLKFDSNFNRVNSLTVTPTPLTTMKS